MKILYLTNPAEDYLSDNILYGLRAKYGPDVVDFPKKDCMYQQGVSGEIYGGGFTLWGMLPDLNIDRDHVQEQLLDGYFDLVIFSDIYRQQQPFAHWTVYLLFEQAKAKGTKFVFLDGTDDGHPTTVDAFKWGTYFKRDNPYNYPEIKIIGLSIPERKLLKDKPTKTKLFTRYVQVDEAYAIDEVARQCNKERFTKEEDYYADLAASQFGITMKKSGWDVPRHMENASQWAVNCIYGKGWEWDGKGWDQKPSYTHPTGLEDMKNCIIWNSAEELVNKISKIKNYDKLSAASRKWVEGKTCEKMAEYVMANI